MQAARATLLLSAAAAAVALGIAVGPVPQDPSYTAFADARAWCGVPNWANVISNVAFVVAGAAGLLVVGRRDAMGPQGPFVEPRERWPYGVFFVGVLATGIGSAYYHVAPD